MKDRSVRVLYLLYSSCFLASTWLLKVSRNSNLFASQRSFHCDKQAERFIIKADSKEKSECVILYSSGLLSSVDHLHIEKIICLRDSRLIIERLYVEINTLKYLKQCKSKLLNLYLMNLKCETFSPLISCFYAVVFFLLVFRLISEFEKCTSVFRLSH